MNDEFSILSYLYGKHINIDRHKYQKNKEVIVEGQKIYPDY